MSVRLVLIVLNAVALAFLAGYGGYVIVSRRRATETKPAPNAVPFLDDEELENPRLERALGWALLFAGITAVSLPLYWLREPTRMDHSVTYFEEGAVERGAVLFADSSDPEHFNSAVSLACASCHGSTGDGGSASTVFDADGPDGPIDPIRVAWKAPALNTVLLRFSEDEVKQIITYGRPGTPMQPWGKVGGGAKNEQSISDLVAFIATLQKSPEQAQKDAQALLEGEKASAAKNVETASDALDSARSSLDEASAALAEQIDDPEATEAELTERCAALEEQIESNPDDVDRDEAAKCADFQDALDGVDAAEQALAWSQDWAARRAGVSDGQVLFELFCARCHTAGWSIFNPTVPGSTDLLGQPGGGGGPGGGIGFNLRDGSTITRFGDGDAGATLHNEFVTNGSEANKAYGKSNTGNGSGRMPGFGDVLTDEMIAAIVQYEREGLDATTYTGPIVSETED